MGGWQSQYPKDKHIVIVGAGYAGSAFGKELLKGKANFTIIDKRSYMHDNITANRAAVIPGFAKKTIIPRGPIFGKHFKQGRITRVDPSTRKVTLSSGDEIRYDTLVIATGSTGPFPTKLDQQNEGEAVKMYEDVVQKVKDSPKVTVLGGGAEIASFYPEKRVTLVHDGPQILNYRVITQQFRETVFNVLTRRLNVKTILGEQGAVSDDNFGVALGKGKEVNADLVIKCTGLMVNSDAYSDGLRDAMMPTGDLAVNAYFQVMGHNNIYAIGDCCAIGDTKLAAHEQAKHLASNLSKYYQGKCMQRYKPNRNPVIMKISLGRKMEEILFRT